MNVLDLFNIGILLFITLFALVSVKDSKEQVINRILAGKFAIFISLHFLTVWSGMTDGAYVDVYRVMLDGIFAYIFYLAGGFYIAFLCVIMALFHIYSGATLLDAEVYTGIMMGFQILQLMYAAWGASDGILSMVSHAYSRCCHRFNRLIGH